MNKRGIGTIEIIVLLASIISALGGAYLGYDHAAPQDKTADEKVIVIDTQGREHVMELEPGRTYDATISPDGKIVVREKK
jgi:hypothetical protein